MTKTLLNRAKANPTDPTVVGELLEDLFSRVEDGGYVADNLRAVDAETVGTMFAVDVNVARRVVLTYSRWVAAIPTYYERRVPEPLLFEGAQVDAPDSRRRGQALLVGDGRVRRPRQRDRHGNATERLRPP